MSTKTHQLLKEAVWRSTGENITTKSIKKGDYSLLNMIDDRHSKAALKANMDIIVHLNAQIDHLEKLVNQSVRASPAFKYLQTINGIGPILAMTIMLEAGDIDRFPSVGNFSSYARCVTSTRLSNNKKKGANNRKNGNRYLSWAFVEAAHSIIRYDKTAHRFYQKKRQQCNGALATKALAHKLARAAYYIMRDQQPYNGQLLFR